ncbi:MAG TPA: cache domain-containing protein, partial [Geobacteraceae bacterium]|nr:cache domain-containing protein [Geobacteraceae bacterium]
MIIRRRFPIREKLTIATVLPLLIAIFICSLIGVFILVAKIGTQAQEKVRSDLNAGLEIYQNEIEHLHDVVRFTATAPYMAQALAAGSRDQVAGVLQPLMKSEQLHIFTAVDARGSVLFRARNPGGFGDDISGDLLIKKALSGKEISGTTIIPASRLALEGAELVRKAVIRIIPTPMAKPVRHDVESAGMFMVAATPVKDSAGNVVGALMGGVLLNNNNSLVDRIRKVIYEGGKQEGSDGGGSTIFLNDLRIATTVMTPERRRAIGTKLSAEVYNRVVMMKERWIGRAFVVNDWYFSGYEPILSLEGVPIGALYVGMLETPFSRLKMNMTFLVIGVLMFGAVMGIGVANMASARLARPIKELEELAGRVAAGERGVTIESNSEDEIGDLADAFNRMSSALTRQEEEIRGLNRGLEQKVQQRTAELEEKNTLLVQTQQALVRVEKLAAIGELAAGVAHEINNPLAIIRGNAELLQMSLPDDSSEQEEIGIISRQVGRMERIVANLLRFARQEHKRIGPAPVNAILDEILAQVGHQIPLDGYELEKRFCAGDLVIQADGDQLRQVFTNIIVNGLQAMPGGGILS